MSEILFTSPLNMGGEQINNVSDLQFDTDEHKNAFRDSLDIKDPGYEVTKSFTTLADETVTTVDEGDFNESVFAEAVDIIIGETYKVTFNGTEYTCVAYDNYGDTALGALWDDNLQNYDYSTYPFNIYSYESDSILRTELRTESSGEYSVKIEHLEDVVEPTEDFKAAVDSVTGYSIDKGNETICIENEIQATQGSSYQFNSSFNLIIGDTYKVTFDGIEYQCICYDDSGMNSIGEEYNSGYHWDEYPFSIDEQDGTVMGNFQTGTHNIKIEHLTISTKTTPEFEKVVHSVTNGVLIQNGNVVNNLIVRPATSDDVAKFITSTINVGDPVIDINGCIPYILQISWNNEYTNSPYISVLSSIMINEYEYGAYYIVNETQSSGSADMQVQYWRISDDFTLLSLLLED